MNAALRYCNTFWKGGLRALFRSLRLRREVNEYLRNGKDLIERYTPTAAELNEMMDYEFNSSVRISIVVPVYNPPGTLLDKAVASVERQCYPDWELVLINDASTDSSIEAKLDRYASSDERIRVYHSTRNEHIAGASNRGVSISSGDFVAFLDQDDELAPHALFAVARAIEDNPTVDIIYSNEDKISCEGLRFSPTFKPAWSREYLFSFMYLGHLMVYRKSLIDELKGFRPEFTGAQDFDLALRATEQTSKIIHVPEILYHWRVHDGSVAGNKGSKSYAYDAGLKALEAMALRNGITATVSEDATIKGIYRWTVAPDRDATVIVYGDTKSFTSVAPLETNCHALIIGPECAHTKGETRATSFSEGLAILLKNTEMQSKTVCFVDARLYAGSQSAVKTLIAIQSLPNVVGVVPKIVCRDRVLLGGASLIQGVVRHHFYNSHVDTAGYGARLWAMHNVSVMPPFAFAVDRSLLEEYNSKGLSTPYEVSLSLSMKALSLGKRLVWTPEATFYCSRDVIGVGEDFVGQVEDQSVLSFIDMFYPSGLDMEERNFRGVI